MASLKKGEVSPQSPKTSIHMRPGDSKRLGGGSFNKYSDSDRHSRPIDLTKEIKYFKVLVDVEDTHRAGLISLLEYVNQGHANLVHSLIKSCILMSNLNQGS